MRRRGLLLAPGLLALAGCTGGGSATPGASPSRYFNDADVTFARTMITLNTRSRRIAHCARGRSLPSALRSLAAAIESTERDENRTMAVWLRNWRPGSAAPKTTSGTDLERLTAAGDDDFPGLFRHALAAAQRAQLTVAAAETRHGINVGARHLARRVTRSRNAELRQLG